MRDQFSAVRQSLSQIAERLEDAARKDWERSKREANQLWTNAGSSATEIARLSVDLSVETRKELKSGLKKLHDQLASAELESQLDVLIGKTGQEPKFEPSSPGFTPETWFGEPADPDDSEETKARRARISQKLAFLGRHYGTDIMNAARTGATIGRFLGRHAAMRAAVVAGGLRLVYIVNDVTATILTKNK